MTIRINTQNRVKERSVCIFELNVTEQMVRMVGKQIFFFNSFFCVNKVQMIPVEHYEM